eukprot:g49984.t1
MAIGTFENCSGIRPETFWAEKKRIENGLGGKQSRARMGQSRGEQDVLLEADGCAHLCLCAESVRASCGRWKA